jgi:hypothetical protein
MWQEKEEMIQLPVGSYTHHMGMEEIVFCCGTLSPGFSYRNLPSRQIISYALAPDRNQLGLGYTLI